VLQHNCCKVSVTQNKSAYMIQSWMNHRHDAVRLQQLMSYIPAGSQRSWAESQDQTWEPQRPAAACKHIIPTWWLRGLVVTMPDSWLGVISLTLCHDTAGLFLRQVTILCQVNYLRIWCKSTQPCIPPGSLNWVSASEKGGKVTSAR